MDPLKDWYRYLDEVSRPARREGEAPPESAWRPWLPDEDADAPEEMVPVEALPELPLLSAPGTFLDPSPPKPPVYQDLTVDDTLQPMPRFQGIALQAPTFELPIPLLKREKKPEKERFAPAARSGAEKTGNTQVAEPAPPASPPGGASLPPLSLTRTGPALEAEEAPAPGEERQPGTMAPRYRELLSQIRSQDVTQNSYKAPFRETREELVQRLLDPPLTLEETARLLGVCPTTIRRYTNKGMLRHFRTSGNQRRFRLSDVLEFLDTRFSEIEADQKVDQETEEFRQNEAQSG